MKIAALLAVCSFVYCMGASETEKETSNEAQSTTRKSNITWKFPDFITNGPGLMLSLLNNCNFSNTTLPQNQTFPRVNENDTFFHNCTYICKFNISNEMEQELTQMPQGTPCAKGKVCPKNGTCPIGYPDGC
uniref:Secreted salivary protein Salp15 n=1 Tax=Ixodes holocyclus TaxID=65647 RepID=A0A1S5R0U1_IXOHO|nr:secreted salivary protein Salp15 [Ixodes holocyclus]